MSEVHPEGEWIETTAGKKVFIAKETREWPLGFQSKDAFVEYKQKNE